MAKNNKWQAHLPKDLDGQLRNICDEQGISNAEALRRVVRAGLQDHDPLENALRQSSMMLIIAAVIALCIALPYGLPAELVLVAGGLGVGAVGTGIAWGVRSGLLDQVTVTRDRSVATDGGERE